MSPSNTVSEREQLILQRIAWLEHRLEGLGANWKRVPILAATCVLGIPVAFIYGFWIGLTAFGLGLSLGGVSAYLLAIRRSTCQDEIRMLRKDLSRLHASTTA